MQCHEIASAVSVPRSASHPCQGLRAAENTCQSVIIARRNRIELVIVAAGTGHRRRQHGPARDVNLLVHDVHQVLLGVFLVDPFGAKSEETGGNHLRIPLGVIRGREQIAGDLFQHKTIVGLVGIHGVNDPVAIAPRCGIGNVAVLARRFRISERYPTNDVPTVRQTGARPTGDRQLSQMPVPTCL